VAVAIEIHPARHGADSATIVHFRPISRWEAAGQEMASVLVQNFRSFLYEIFFFSLLYLMFRLLGLIVICFP
jgi:membrane protein required for beta-lactamase induction